MAERLIDAEALAEKIKEKINVLERDLLLDKGSWLSNIRLVWFKKLLIMVEALPTIEAKPVVHAHWEKVREGLHICSYCKVKAPIESDEYDYMESLSAYCPLCGSQMDEKESD